MSNVKLEAIDKRYAEEEAKLQQEYEKKRAAVLDISNDPALEPPVQLETGYASCVIVDNVPVVPEAMVGRAWCFGCWGRRLWVEGEGVCWLWLLRVE
jgi:hypothetical protein